MYFKLQWKNIYNDGLLKTNLHLQVYKQVHNISIYSTSFVPKYTHIYLYIDQSA